MTWYLTLAAVGLLAVAIAFYFRADIFKAGVSAVVSAVFRKSKTDEAKDHQDRRRAVERNISGRERER